MWLLWRVPRSAGPRRPTPAVSSCNNAHVEGNVADVHKIAAALLFVFAHRNPSCGQGILCAGCHSLAPALRLHSGQQADSFTRRYSRMKLSISSDTFCIIRPVIPSVLSFPRMK